MDFQNRVTLPSIKNFQLCDDNHNVVLQFGRVGKDQFTMDFTVFILETEALKSLIMMCRVHSPYFKPFASVVLDFCCNVYLFEVYEVCNYVFR